MGILTDGENVLFYHGLSDNSGKEVMYIYPSFESMFVTGESEIAFPWTSENEEKLINYLNKYPESGDASVISYLSGFKPDEME